MTRKRISQIALVVLCLAIFIAAFASLFFWVNSQILQRLYPIKYSEIVQLNAQEFAVDEYLLYAVINTESGFKERAESSAAARGLMQLTEDTFDWIKTKIDPQSDLVFDDMYIPEHNIRFGAFFVGYCLDRYGGDVSTAAAAYHSGVGAVDKLLQDPQLSANGITLDVFPNDVLAHYVKKINSNYSKYLSLYARG